MTDERLGLPSASEMRRNKDCPGNRILVHSLREKGFLRGEVSSPEATLGQRIHASLEGEPEDLEAKAKDIRDSCDHLATKAADQFFPFPNQDPVKTIYEHRLWYKIGDTPFFSGRPDRFYVSRSASRLLDINFKTGRGDEDEAAINYQLRTEVVLLDHAYPEVDEMGVAIIQPLVTHTPEIATYDREQRNEALLEILEIVDQTFWETARFAGPHCKFCPGRAFCPEAREFSVTWPLKVNVDALPLGVEGAEILRRVKIAKKLLEGVEDEYKRLVQETPGAIEGWWIGKGKNIRYINGWKRAREIACAEVDPSLVAGLARDFDNLLSLPIQKLEQFAFDHGIPIKLFSPVVATKKTEGSLEPIPKKYLK
jgi:hypothetical protein